MGGQVHLCTSEPDAFGLEPQALFAGIIRGELDRPARTRHSVPGQAIAM